MTPAKNTTTVYSDLEKGPIRVPKTKPKDGLNPEPEEFDFKPLYLTLTHGMKPCISSFLYLFTKINEGDTMIQFQKNQARG